AGQANGAQAYPQCFNLEITGDGAEVPAGVLGTKLYSAEDPGIVVNIYTTGLTYTIPGPALIAGASASVPQSSSAITATGTATVGNGAEAEPTNPPAATTTAAQSSAAQTTAAPSTQKTSTAAVSTPTTLATSTRVAAPTTPTTTAVATPTAAPTGAVGAQTLYGQCGGNGFAGPTACAEGTCKSWNPYYSQCVNTA
ncbi:hypothetical protein PC116_g31168, partial [Phytophthora cactorum]